MMLRSITKTSTALLSTSTNPRPKKSQNHGMRSKRIGVTLVADLADGVVSGRCR